MKYLKSFHKLFESISQDELNYILDKISNSGIESISNLEKKKLDSFSDSSIDIEGEIKKAQNKYQTAKQIIKDIPLSVDEHPLRKDIGRYVRLIKVKEDDGIVANAGMIYEIVGVQKHWGHDEEGRYAFNRIGYRIALVGIDNDFGRVGDVNEVEFVNMTEEEALNHNTPILKRIGLLRDNK